MRNSLIGLHNIVHYYSIVTFALALLLTCKVIIRFGTKVSRYAWVNIWTRTNILAHVQAPSMKCTATKCQIERRGTTLNIWADRPLTHNIVSLALLKDIGLFLYAFSP